jgi:hypothetical protein
MGINFVEGYESPRVDGPNSDNIWRYEGIADRLKAEMINRTFDDGILLRRLPCDLLRRSLDFRFFFSLKLKFFFESL